MKTIDESTFESLLELDRDTGGELVFEMIDAYRSDHPNYLKTLKSRIDDQDAAGVVFQAHAMKSTFANFGALKLAELFRAIELAAKVPDWATIQSSLDQALKNIIDFENDLSEVEHRAKATAARKSS